MRRSLNSSDIALLQADARIEVDVEDVGDRIDGDVDHGCDKNDALNRGKIAVVYSFDSQPAQALAGEDRLDHNRSAQQVGYLQGDDSDDRDQSIAHAMVRNNVSFMQSSCPCGGQISLIQHIEHARSDQPCDDGSLPNR